MNKILIAGGTGLIGSRLIEYLSREDLHFHILTRSPKADNKSVSYFKWDPSQQTIDQDCFKDVSVVINLAGAGIADKRWSDQRKKVILDSRLDSIATLHKGLTATGSKPELYIGASAIGYYGDRGSQAMTEDSEPGTGFLSEVTKKWEDKHKEIFSLFQRNILLRIGIVLSENGGALKEMLKPARFGQYGYFGNGKAYYSWIHIDDICQIIRKSMEDKSYNGIYNATAPDPVTIKELVRAMKKAKGGFGLLMPVPEIGLKLVLGEMSQMLTGSMNAVPKKLTADGHQFIYNDPEKAIRDILKRNV